MKLLFSLKQKIKNIKIKPIKVAKLTSWHLNFTSGCHRNYLLISQPVYPFFSLNKQTLLWKLQKAALWGFVGICVVLSCVSMKKTKANEGQLHLQVKIYILSIYCTHTFQRSSQRTLNFHQHKRFQVKQAKSTGMMWSLAECCGH